MQEEVFVGAVVDLYYINLLTWIQEFEADGDQRDGEEALQGGGRGIRGSVGYLCGERRDVCEGRSAP